MINARFSDIGSRDHSGAGTRSTIVAGLSSGAQSRRAVQAAVAAAVVVAFVVLGLLATAVPAPRILTDELRYTLATASLVDGDGLEIRGEEYGYGPVYPVLLAPLLAVSSDREAAYPLFKLLNALLFALTAVPAYLLARRLLPPWWSAGVAALAVAIPSTVYASLVMTESVGYLAAVTAVLLVVRAVERATPGRQFAALAAIGVATLTRAQFAVLFFAYVAALVVQWVLVRDTRSLRNLWPTLGAIVLGLAAVVLAPLVLDLSYRDLLGGYDDLWSEYDLVDVARWTVYHLTALELYLAVVPFAVAPIVLWRLWAGRTREGVAFAVVFVAVNALVLLAAAAFTSTEYGLERLHDRYLFYAVPLWLVVLAVWLHDGLPRPLVATAIGVGAAIVLPLVTPFSQLSFGERGGEVDAVITNLWAEIQERSLDDPTGLTSGRRVLVLFVLAVVLAVALLPRRLWPTLVVPVAAVALVTGALAWSDAVDEGEDMSRILGDDPTWLDDAVRGEAVSIYAPPPCEVAAADLGLLLTEFFNESVGRVTYLTAPDASLLPADELRIRPGGVLQLASGEPLRATHVVAPSYVPLAGDTVVRGTSVPLLVRRVDGVVRLAGPLPQACSS
jgi:Dolichyl-phosphate-mannose-protein mannosyltransferase